MSIRDEEVREAPHWTALHALTARSDPERRRILELMQKQQTARAIQLEKLCHHTLNPHQPSWIKKTNRDTVKGR